MAPLRSPTTIVSVAYPFAPVVPDAIGGAEQIVAMLDRGLVARGYRSIVVAQEGSRTSGECIEVPALAGQLDETRRKRIQAEAKAIIREAIEKTSADLVHLHGLDFASYLEVIAGPALVTLHLPPNEGLERFSPNVRFNFVSEDARRALGSGRGVAIENGVEVERYTRCAAKDGYVLGLGRICYEKGFDLAIDAARLAGVPILLGGQVFPYPAHEQYFEEMLAPRLGLDAVFAGPLAGSAKIDALARARCLLVPSRVAETSSLAAMEALASGTPVVTFARGALAGIIENGKTGFLVDSVDQMAAAIRMCDRLDTSECVRAARERFSSRRMCDSYMALYQQMIAKNEKLSSVRTNAAAAARD